MCESEKRDVNQLVLAILPYSFDKLLYSDGQNGKFKMNDQSDIVNVERVTLAIQFQTKKNPQYFGYEICNHGKKRDMVLSKLLMRIAYPKKKLHLMHATDG